MAARIWVLLLCTSGCSLVATSDNYTFSEAGTPDAGIDAGDATGSCTTASECTAPPNTGVDCVAGACVSLGCLSGFSDCDDLPSNGCEVTPIDDVRNCGMCGRLCTAPSAVPVCESNSCTIGECLGETGNCDGNINNGCEASITTGENCGDCGIACPDTQPFCQSSEDTYRCVETCSEGFDLCGGTMCVNLESSVSNCGDCGEACEGLNAIWECSTGSCAVADCLEGWANCNGEAGDGCEADTTTSLANCGGCGTACEGGNAMWACSVSACTPAGCLGAFEDCDGTPATCEVNTGSDLLHCGGCDIGCGRPNSTWSCETGSCTFGACTGGFESCDGDPSTGCEVETAGSDAANCGGCGIVCDGECVSGSCNPIVAGAAGAFHSCVIRGRGEVVCWGWDDTGQLGQGVTRVPLASPTIITNPETTMPLLGAAVASGGQTTFLVDTGGRIWSWGLSAEGALGRPAPFATPGRVVALADTAFDAAAFVQVAAGGRVGCGRSSTGKLWCWGSAANGQILGAAAPQTTALDQGFDGLSPATSVVDVAVGPSHVCAAFGDGHVECWGSNATGQHGTGSTAPAVGAALPTGLPTDVLDVEASNGGTCARTAAGQLFCWGSNTYGNMGVAAPTVITSPVRVGSFGAGAAPVTELSMQLDVTCFMTASSAAATSVYCMGRASSGGVGNGLTTPNVRVPTRIDLLAGNEELLTATSLFSGHRLTCALLANGDAACFGTDEDGQVSDDQSLLRLTPETQLDGAGAPIVGNTSVASGAEFGCRVASSGEVYCWGTTANRRNGIDIGVPSSTAIHRQVTGLTLASDVATSSFHACAVADTDGNGSVEIGCWGNNQHGKLGPGAPGETGIPNAVTLPGPPTEVALGEQHTCAIYTSVAGPRVSCWGWNPQGELGRVTATPSGNAPGDVVGLGTCVPEHLELGRNFSCALCADESVMCWGLDSVGQRGDGASALGNEVPRPVVGLSSVVALAAGEAHACAVADEDSDSALEVWCWGQGSSGQVGNGSFSGTHPAPVRVVDIDDVQPVLACGGAHSCVGIGTDVFCWGHNNYGNLGNGLQVRSARSVRVLLPPGPVVTELRSGDYLSQQTVALRSDGSIIAWGDNRYGACGGGETIQNTTAQLMTGAR